MKKISSNSTLQITSFLDRKTPSPNKSPLEKEELFQAVKEVGPRVYELTGLRREKPCYWVLGCQGNGDQDQKQVAKLMEETLASEPETRPDFILILGDNVYDYGANSPYHVGFKDFFHDIYGSEECPNLSTIPCFLLLGNHDANCHKGATYRQYFSSQVQKRAIEINEVAHHYIPQDDDESVDDVKDQFQQDKLSLPNLKQYNMPYYYYALIAGNKQIFFLDSNVILEEILEFAGSSESKQECYIPNQIEWLLTEYQKAKEADREIIFAQHHPPYTSGKRANPKKYDTYQYLTSEQVQLLNKLLETNTESYNELIHVLYNRLNLFPKEIYAAHDHFICIDDATNEFLLLTCGGGGGSKQSCESFLRHPDMKVHLKQNGFAIVSKNGIEIRTTRGFKLLYDPDNHVFKQTSSLDSQVQELKEACITACDNYINLLKNHELMKSNDKDKKSAQEKSRLLSGVSFAFSSIINTANSVIDYFSSNNDEEIQRLNELKAFFNQTELPDFDSCMRYLKTFPESANVNSFYQRLKLIINRFEHEIDDLVAAMLSLNRV